MPANIPPRWSPLSSNWRSFSTMHDAGDPEVADDFVDDIEYDGRTPLDKTIDRIGMGPCLLSSPLFRSSLVFLCRELPVDTSLTLWFR